MAALIPEIQGAQAQLAQYYSQGRRFEAAGPEFRLIRATARDLERVGYPPRPDDKAHPEVFTIWRDVFSLELTYEEARFALPGASYGEVTGTAVGFTHHESSNNWSGAYITPRDGLMITDLFAFWYVPTVTPPAGGLPGGTYGSSTWIGIDGQREYFHRTMPQVGTAQFLNLAGAPGSTTQAWVQWWPMCPVVFGMLVVPGDLMFAWLHVVSLTEVQFILVNISRLKVTPYTLPAPFVSMPPMVPTFVQTQVSGATAEWIMERPAICPNPVPLQLPKFSTVDFFGCYALAARAPGPAVAEYALVSPRLIRMYEGRESPHRTVTVAKAARPNYSSARVTHRP